MLLRTWLPYDWTPRSEAYFVFPLAQGTPGKQCGLAATGVYQPSLRSPWLAAAAEKAPAMGKAELLAAQATLVVTAIDHKTREVTLKNEEGEEKTFVIGKEARNLDQVNVGDIVSIKMADVVAVRLYPVKTVAKSRVEKVGNARSDLGQKPHVSISRHLELTGRIAELDKEKRIVTLEGKDGSITTKVADDVDLSEVKKGDMVRIDLLEMLSITVNAPGK
ncbi:hypothetical protein [Thiolapillus sp.]|uniref:hypothetical protein n=1 Tax=Thiolapillus sp. TaxID=2017437 RepID=UPI003AF86A82